jgi:alkanesulfonate monooxygenase SsuD/methylene tetrahydromethanopterin reductase-like flavin-dependent oxidoreductase (luciferase family)
MSRRLITAIDIDGAGQHPGAWRGSETDPAAILTGELALRAVQRAEAAGVDLATFADTLEAPADDVARVSARVDALALAARIAPVTDRIGLVPTVTTTHTEPFHLQASVATLDHVSYGRAGWLVEVSTTDEAAAVIGRRTKAPAAETWREARYVVDVSRRLWDSWEDDAIIRDVETGRFIDRDRLHYVGFESPSFSVKGPSIVPRPPQGHPVTFLRLSSQEALQVAGDADVVLLPGVADLQSRVGAAREAGAGKVLLSLSVLLADDIATALRRADDLGPGTVELDHVGGVGSLADSIIEWVAAGVDGIHLRPASLEVDVPVIADRLLPLLREKRLVGPTTDRPQTLRNRLGLRRPTNQYAAGSQE